MEQFLVSSSLQRNPSAYKDQIRWTRCIAELEGRLSPKFRHQNSHLLLNSYSQTGTFTHISDDGEANCRTTLDTNSALRSYLGPSHGVTAVEFDAKGIYVASVTKSGCLSVHDFETLYCTIHGPSSLTSKCTGKPLVHIPTSMALNAVKWNPSNQDEVACASRRRDKIFLFDISYVSAEPIEVLEIGRSRFSGSRFSDIQEGFSDIVFLSEDKSRLLASSLNGGIYMWDRRVSTTNCLEQFTKSSSECQFNSLELDRESRVVFGAGRNGIIYAWDLRGGRSSFAFQRSNEVPVLTSLKVSSMLEKIKDLKEQSNIVSREIHSIKFDPSCPYQLAFHLDDGWSGVINVNDLSVTHVHCPPPNWLGGIITCTIIRRPAWLPTFSVYAVSSSSKEIYLLDFYPDKTSPSHIYFNDEIETLSGGKRRLLQNKLISLSKDVICCAVHPFNGTIVAGTEESSLIVVSQPGTSGEDGE